MLLVLVTFILIQHQVSSSAIPVETPQHPLPSDLSSLTLNFATFSHFQLNHFLVISLVSLRFSCSPKSHFDDITPVPGLKDSGPGRK